MKITRNKNQKMTEDIKINKPDEGQGYTSAEEFERDFRRIERALPKNPVKRRQIIRALVKKYLTPPNEE